MQALEDLQKILFYGIHGVRNEENNVNSVIDLINLERQICTIKNPEIQDKLLRELIQLKNCVFQSQDKDRQSQKEHDLVAMRESIDKAIENALQRQVGSVYIGMVTYEDSNDDEGYLTRALEVIEKAISDAYTRHDQQMIQFVGSLSEDVVSTIAFERHCYDTRRPIALGTISQPQTKYDGTVRYVRVCRLSHMPTRAEHSEKVRRHIQDQREEYERINVQKIFQRIIDELIVIGDIKNTSEHPLIPIIKGQNTFHYPING